MLHQDWILIWVGKIDIFYIISFIKRSSYSSKLMYERYIEVLW
jgi:hypothetical protein